MRIGELAQLSGTSNPTIRFYEQQGLLPEPARTSGGYRDYPDESVARLAFIRRAQLAGLALRDVRDILAIHDTGQEPCVHVQQLLAHRLDEVHAQLRELASLQSYLESLLVRAANPPAVSSANASVCWILEPEDAP